MKKIPTLFEREFKDHNVIKILPKVHPGMEWGLKGEGVATVKYDGSCCAIIDGEYYKRYDCKKGKIPPEGFIPCCEPDSITGHWPGWVNVDENNPSDKWFVEAYYVTSCIQIKVLNCRMAHMKLTENIFMVIRIMMIMMP